MDEEDLANLIYKYGDERKSRYIARRVVEERAVEPITTTLRLADMIRAAEREAIAALIRPFETVILETRQ